ncbi:hypothetical protein ACIHEJ_20320 [Streptomyces sp. NPDC052301]|uniref:hypothetical protein n=1 Tax=Streptomyces sp. NPDC052301 TaxID=3365687 RepID=UPI0037D61D0A
MIKPESIPLFTGDLGQLEEHVRALRREADGIRQAGGEAHRQFQGLSAFYKAPEAEDLFASTAPARDAADAFADKVDKVADALVDYAIEVGPIAKRLEHLKSKATTFVAGLKTSTGEFDKSWNNDADKVEEHQALMHDVDAAQAAFWAAEVTCSNKITALVGGTKYAVNTDGKQHASPGTELYGYGADVLDHTKELPWGTPVAQHYDWWDPHDFNHYFKSFVWDGLIVDNVWGSIKGLGSMVGLNGSQAFKDTWSGLGRVFIGADTYLHEMGGKKPSGFYASDYAQGSKAYAKEFAKSFVAWDEWKENPARASATVLFNGLTLGAGPLGVAAKAGKFGAVARGAGVAAKIGEVIDPVSGGLKAAGAVVRRMPKVSEVTSRILAGVDTSVDVTRVHSVIELADGSKVVIRDGEFVAYDKHGHAVNEAPMQERSAARSPAHQQAPVPEREPAGVGGRGAGQATGVGDGADHVAPARGGSSGAGGSGAHHGGAGGGRSPLDAEREIMRRQVERANNDPKWFKKHYRSNGYRRSTTAQGGYGQAVPQLVADPFHPGKWIAKSDMPPAIKEHFVHDDPVLGKRSDVHPGVLHELDKQAAARHEAIKADKAAEDELEKAEKAYAANPTDELAGEVDKADAKHSPLHGDANRQSELFGEDVAERHAIPEHYRGAVRVDDGAFGNNRFDQVYKTPDGRYVVVEAKGSTKARLGVRKGHSGRLVTQGSREYFETILAEMKKRATVYQRKGMLDQARAEKRLAGELQTALDDNNVDYVLVQAKADGTRYAGYEMKQFDIAE